MSVVRKYRFVLLSALMAIAVVPAVWAQEKADPFSQEWNQRASSGARPTENEAGGPKYLDNLLKLRLENGINDLYSYSGALVMEAIEAEEMNYKQASADLLARAGDLAPDYPGVDMTKCSLDFRRGQIIGAVASFIRGSMRKVSSFQGSLPVLFNVLSVILLALFWTLTLFGAMLIARYAKLVAHDMHERIHGFSTAQAYILSVIILLFPAAFIPNLAGYALLVMLLLWVYMSNRERAVGAVFAVLLLVSPVAINVMGHGISVLNEPTFQSIMRIREGRWSAQDISTLEGSIDGAANETRKADVTFSLAVALMYSNRFEEAEPLLKNLLNAEGIRFEANLMLGNLYYRWKKYEQALKQYQACVKLYPESVEVHFNLAAALSRPEMVDVDSGYLKMADGELETAEQLDQPRFETLRRYLSLLPGRFVVDARLPLGRLYGNMMEKSEARTEASREIFAGLAGANLPVIAAPIVSLIVLILMGVLIWFSGRLSLSAGCKRCGKAFCPKCQTPVGKGDSCVRCYYAFEQVTGLDIRVREKVRAEARLHMNRMARISQIISVFIPGSGHMLMGKPATGAAITFTSLTLVLGILYRNGILKSLWPTPRPVVLMPVILAAVLYVLFLVVVVVRAGVPSRQN